jgi:ribosomal protein S18 acetylase RimI-like enzyme
MIFTPASPADISKIVSLVNGAYRGESAQAGWTHEGEVLAGQRIDSPMLAEMLASGNVTILLMRDHEHGPLAGCVSLQRTGEAATWYVGMLTIDPLRQAEGLGRILLSRAEDHLRKQGVTRARMTVIWLRESLIKWYERRGYHRTGQIEPFPYGDRRFGVPLRDDLHFVVMEKALIEPSSL